jgi:hypothetical protein
LGNFVLLVILGYSARQDVEFERMSIAAQDALAGPAALLCHHFEAIDAILV